MRKDQFYSAQGTIIKLPKKIGEDKTGAPIAMMQVAIKSYGNMPVKLWRGLARQVLSPEVGLQVGDIIFVDGHIERRRHVHEAKENGKDVVKIFDDVFLTADKYSKNGQVVLEATDVEYIDHKDGAK